MLLPKNNLKLIELFKEARQPKLTDLQGEYFVDMLTGLPSLRVVAHRKVFLCGDGKTVGYNEVFANKVWGHFFVEQGVYQTENCSLDVTVINYRVKENSFFTARMIDYVRSLEDGKLYLGRFNYWCLGKPRFLGYFSLVKK